MVPGATPATVLDEDHAAFVQSGLSIVVASRSTENIPSVVRALGCRVASDRRTITVLMWAAQAAALLDDVRATGTIAVVFTRPSTHRTIQVKGTDAAVVPPAEGDSDIVARTTNLLVEGLDGLGFPPGVVRTSLRCDPDELAAVAFTPGAAFDQTPGPRAGKPLGSLPA
jgi:hypothetical protein